MPRSFVHLHTHTEFSMLDGAARVQEIVAKAVGDGMPALGITDHGNMYGILDFYKACHDEGITPVLGTELYMAGESRHERPARRGRVDDTGGEGERGEKLYYHLTALAETTRGYHNLMKLSSEAYLSGYWYKSRADWELLDRYHDGLIVTTGCLGGLVLQSLMRDDMKGAVEKAARLQDIFGRDSMFVELQDHGLPEQHRTNPLLLDLARRIQAPLLATNDSHYTNRSDALAHDALLCVQTGSLMDDPDRFKFHGDDHYLKTAAEMRSLFSELPEACDNTLWIAERANVEIEFGRPQLPQFDLPEGFGSQGEYLRHLTFEGARERYGDPLPSAVVERLDYELSVIEGMGFSAYFLVVWDLIHHAKSNGIRVGPGRGSAAGCCVAYCLRIVELDPIRYDLLFERFLNPGRRQMPDIDMDFDSRYRGEMIRYAAEKYGWDHVAQIITFSTIKARAAVRDAARVLGYPYGLGDRIAKAMPPLVMGRDTPLWACFQHDPKFEDGYKVAQELRDMYATDPDVQKVVDVARGLEGLRRQDGIHAAAVVITKEPLTEYLPIQRKPGPGEKPEDAPIVTQYEMHGVEELGLLKMDFLGVRNLDVIEMALDLIESVRGERPDIDNIPLDDDATLAMLRRGESIGVFQLEGGPMRTLMRSLAPTSFEDVAALVALYRPGPMAANMHNDYADRKNGRKPIDYLHPDMAEALDGTYGLMVFQEQLMRVAEKFAGYSLEEADNLRKACLPRGTLVMTLKRGYLPIEEVMDLADRQVQTIDTTSCVTRFDWVSDVWPVGVKPVFRLTTSSGYSICATSEHPFLVEGQWRRLSEIDPGDLVAVAAHTRTEGGSTVSTAEVELAALLISEGHTPDPDGPTPGAAQFCNTDPQLLAIFRSAFATYFGYQHTRGSVVNGGTRYRLTRAETRRLRPELGKFGLSANKSVPLRYINAPKWKVERFLGLYFCADGWADSRGVHYASKSKDVCLALKRMLLRCGIVSSVGKKDIPGHGSHWTLSVSDSGQAKEFARLVEPHLTDIKANKVARWLVEWAQGPSATRIGVPASFLTEEPDRRQQGTGKSRHHLAGDIHQHEKTRVLHRSTIRRLLHSERLEDLATGDLVWDTVVSMEYVGEMECFDFRMSDPDRPYAVVEDFLAHNCGKKIREVMAKERQSFVSGCERQGYEQELGTKLFDMIEPFADYAFNKSHSYGYGMVAYQTAYLKAHYPAEYLAALLTSVKDDKDRTAPYLAECRSLGVQVRVPDVNTSVSDFSARVAGFCDDELPPGSPGVIPFGLSAVRNVGEGIVAQLVEEREQNGPFTDFYDFCQRVDPMVLNKRAVESLIKAGAFDSLGLPRKGLLLVHEQVIDRTLARRRERDAGVMSLFDAFDSADDAPTSFDDARIPVPDVEFDKHQRLVFEKEMLGLYVSDHPLMGYEASLRRATECSLTELLEAKDGETRTVGGVVTGLVRKYTRKGELMATFALEDLEASVPAWVFPRTMQDFGPLLADDAVVVVKGRLDNRDDEVKLVVMEVRRPELVIGAAPLEVVLPLSALSDRTVERLKEILLAHPGAAPVYLRMGSKTLALADQFRVDTRNGLCAELRMLLGADCITSA